VRGELVLAVERRFKVLERIAADQAVEVSSLAREFGVSEMTIRRTRARCTTPRRSARSRCGPPS
jgi:predicted DNA-binding transcriptional regulator YafY